MELEEFQEALEDIRQLESDGFGIEYTAFIASRTTPLSESQARETWTWCVADWDNDEEIYEAVDSTTKLRDGLKYVSNLVSSIYSSKLPYSTHS